MAFQKYAIRCPICHQRMLDADSEAARHTLARPAQLGSHADYEIKCPKCKRIISLICRRA